MLPLEISRDPKASEKAQEALEKVGLGHRKTHFPYQMSGGEAQRTAIARALVVEPALLLLDEPSGNLDTATGKKVMDLMFGLVEKLNMTTVLVTHSEELAKQCGRRLQLLKGQLSS
jgi:putative ABC transport system ATP-binding protein